MDKTLESFLHPHRKPNVKFRLPSFDAELEMRALSIDETTQIDKEATEKSLTYTEVLNRYAVEALVVPNLHNKELLDALSEREGHKILNSYDAYKVLFSGPEAALIMSKYVDIANLDISFSEKVEEAKN